MPGLFSGLCCKVSTRPATKRVQQHLLVWWAVVCVTHTNILEKLMVLWNCFVTDYTFVAFVLARAKVFFGASICAFWNADWWVLCCRIYPLKVTGHWNDTEKICMILVCNDMCNSRNVVQTRCRCRTCLERNVCTTPRPAVMLSARVFKEKRFLPYMVVFDMNVNRSATFFIPLFIRMPVRYRIVDVTVFGGRA